MKIGMPVKSFIMGLLDTFNYRNYENCKKNQIKASDYHKELILLQNFIDLFYFCINTCN